MIDIEKIRNLITLKIQLLSKPVSFVGLEN